MEKVCESCNVGFKTYNSKRRYCSRECAQKYKKQVVIEKVCEYTGCTETFETKEGSTREKRFCSKECQIFWQKYSQLGENNGNYGRENKWGNHSETVRDKIRNKVKKHWETDDRRNKHKTALENYKKDNGYWWLHSPQAREKISESTMDRIVNNNHNVYTNCVTGYHTSSKSGVDEYYHSSWELNRMGELDNDNSVVFWTKKHDYIIHYVHNNVTKKYLPDFYIKYVNGDEIIEEVKGYIEDEKVYTLKCESAIKFCEQNGMEYKVNKKRPIKNKE